MNKELQKEFDFLMDGMSNYINSYGMSILVVQNQKHLLETYH